MDNTSTGHAERRARPTRVDGFCLSNASDVSTEEQQRLKENRGMKVFHSHFYFTVTCLYAEETLLL